jgi:glycosyltransferase involved in cell wall biosynthesis
MKKALLLAPMGSVHRRFNRANIEALLALGYSVELCANFENGDGPESHNEAFVAACRKEGIPTHSIPFGRHSLLASLRCLPRLKALLKAEKYDIVHTHTETGGLLLKLAVSAKGESKFCYTPHGMSFWKGSGWKSQLIYKPLERWICSAMELNFGMNREEVDSLNRWNSATATYVHGIGLNIERMQSPTQARNLTREAFGVGPNELLIASVGELDDNKNHIAAVRALARLNRRDFKYVICGVGPRKEALLQEAARLGIGNQVLLVGFRSDIPDVLHASDLFVFPSFHEGMPVSVLEAMASGLPVVCSNIRGNVDVIAEGDNGYLFAPSDVETLTSKLAWLMDHAELRAAMGARNRADVVPFSLHAVTHELTQIYSHV